MISSDMQMQHIWILINLNQLLIFVIWLIKHQSVELANDSLLQLSWLLNLNILHWVKQKNRQFDYVIFSMFYRSFMYTWRNQLLYMWIIKTQLIYLSIWFFIFRSSIFKFNIMQFENTLKMTKSEFNFSLQTEY